MAWLSTGLRFSDVICVSRDRREDYNRQTRCADGSVSLLILFGLFSFLFLFSSFSYCLRRASEMKASLGTTRLLLPPHPILSETNLESLSFFLWFQHRKRWIDSHIKKTDKNSPFQLSWMCIYRVAFWYFWLFCCCCYWFFFFGIFQWWERVVVRSPSPVPYTPHHVWW